MVVDLAQRIENELESQRPWLRRLAYVLVHDGAIAEDLVQDAAAAALSSQPSFDESLRPWLAKVVRNLVRSRARHARSVVRWQHGLMHTTLSPSPEDIALRDEAKRQLTESVGVLDEPYRSTVLLCYDDGLSPTEVARRLGLPPGTVRWRLKHALDEIRTQVGTIARENVAGNHRESPAARTSSVTRRVD